MVYTKRLDRKMMLAEMQAKGFEVTDLLVKSPGKPADWEDNPANVSKIGFAVSGRTLSQEKVASFLLMDYKQSLDLLDMKGL